MTDNTSKQVPLKEQTLKGRSFYQIPKRLVWSVTAIPIFWLVYKVNDSWRHQNWPPADLRNVEITKSLDCNKNPRGFVTKAMLGDDPNDKTYRPVGFDRMDFIESPGCVGARLYLPYEGTGIREEWNVYDMTTKRKTANIVITHERFDHK